ncbi:hypothetical protein C8R48DRAFT_774573 [Suillus tomentosus]|nr:hypothetical protein C8R48DRAFT_774573 [Suillus tomentosus]
MPQPLKRTFALYMESDEEDKEGEPLQNINDVLMSIHLRYSLMNFPQYLVMLKERGIIFYEEKVGMLEGAAYTFHSHKILQESSNASPQHDILLDARNSNSGESTTYDPISTPPYLPPGKWANAPSAAELRFAHKYLGGDADMSMIDVKKGKDIFLNGIKDMMDKIIQDAVLAVQADREYACLLAITSAWASFFEASLAKCTRPQLEDDVDFTITAYVEDFMAFTVADMKLDQLEDVADARKLDLPMDNAAPER